jgi:hypothetical protein
MLLFVGMLLFAGMLLFVDRLALLVENGTAERRGMYK